MPRIKKNIDDAIVEVEEKKEEAMAVPHDFGRDDLNEMRDVVNMLASKVK